MGLEYGMNGWARTESCSGLESLADSVGSRSFNLIVGLLLISWD